MISAVVVMLSLAVLGLPIAMRLDRDARGGGLIGLAFLLATGLVSVVMLAMSVVAWRWSLVVIVAIVLLISIATFIALRGHPASDREDPLPTVLSLILDGATLFCVTGHALYATLTAPWSWDFWAIWGLKAKVFFLREGIDWEWLSRPFNDFAHPDYPPLVPLLFDFMLLPHGAFDDRWLGVVYVAFVLAAIGVVRDLLLRGSGDRNLASVGGVIAAGTLSNPWIGLAEIPLIAFIAASLLYLRHAEKSGDERSVSCGAILLGLAALTKNEGLAFLATTGVVAVVVFRRSPRMVSRLWPAVVIAGGWQLIRLLNGLRNDLFVGEVRERAVTKLENVNDVFSALIAHPPDRHFFWVIMLTIIFLGLRHIIRHERFLGAALAMQFCIYVGSYVVTPHDVVWHVSTSWPRLADQLALPLSMLALFILFKDDQTPIPEKMHAAR